MPLPTHPVPLIKRCTARQVSYILILFDECGFNTDAKRSAFLQMELANDELRFASDLTLDQARVVIDSLRRIHEQQQKEPL